VNLPAFKEVFVGKSTNPPELARLLTQLVANIREAISPLLQHPESVCTYQTVELSAATPTILSHRLGVTPLGWEVVDKDAAANIWRTAWDTKTITLIADNSCTIKLKVF
jgi:hypothetical protein